MTIHPLVKTSLSQAFHFFLPCSIHVCCWFWRRRIHLTIAAIPDTTFCRSEASSVYRLDWWPLKIHVRQPVARPLHCLLFFLSSSLINPLHKYSMCTIQVDCSCSPYGADSQGKKTDYFVVVLPYRSNRISHYKITCHVNFMWGHFRSNSCFKCNGRSFMRWYQCDLAHENLLFQFSVSLWVLTRLNYRQGENRHPVLSLLWPTSLLRVQLSTVARFF